MLDTHLHKRLIAQMAAKKPLSLVGNEYKHKDSGRNKRERVNLSFRQATSLWKRNLGQKPNKWTWKISSYPGTDSYRQIKALRVPFYVGPFPVFPVQGGSSTKYVF